MKQSNQSVRIQAIAFVAIIVALAWHGLRQRSVELDSGVRQVMGTFTRILVVAPDKKTALSAIEAGMTAITRVDTLMSDWDPNSQLSEVNRRAFLEPVMVDADLFEVLSAAMDCSKLSDGAFDITIAPVVLLWRQTRQTGIAPTDEQVAAARAKVGYKNLLLDGQAKTVRFAVEGMALDLGGIAKGYAVDRAVTALKQAGALGGMVSVGGEVYCFGTPAGKQPHWYIGLQDPADDDRILLKLKLDGRAVSTSGDYQQFVIINGQKHSHIVNPATAQSAADLSSATIIAPTSMQADALATAVSVLGPEKGLAMIESVPDVEALLIPSGQPNTFRKTPGVDPYIEDTLK